MSEQSIDRFDELEAGRILGDLDAEEWREWNALANSSGGGPDFTLELTAAAVETEFLMQRSKALPPSLAEALRSGITALDTDPAPLPDTAAEPDNIIRPAAWRKILATPTISWGVAAVLGLLLVATSLREPPAPISQPQISVTEPTEISGEWAKSQLLQNAKDVLRVDFGGAGSYTGMKGDVVWSDSLQEGYMTLEGLPVNSPSVNQYQLWIVDPKRGKQPVDGGVFDIDKQSGEAIVKIRNPLRVSSPQAFVITLEQPGGVVVSDQDIVVAVAAPKV